jgi:lipopolysaccharide transport system permease protein
MMTSLPNAQNDEAVAAVVIRGSSSPWALQWGELWRHRELLYFLAWRDVKVGYSQTILGAAWVILQPMAIALALAAFLGRVVHLQSDVLPYPVFVYSGMVLWQLFAKVLIESSNSIVGNEQLISKVYFPRLFIPMSVVLSSLVDFAVSLAALVLFLVYFKIAPSATAVLFPFLALPAVIASLGVGLWLSSLNVKFRDVRNALGFLVQCWFFATPIAYPTHAIPLRWRVLYEFNPMVGVVDGARWVLRGQGPFPTQSVSLSILVAAALFMTGLYYFRRTEETFADFI